MDPKWFPPPDRPFQPGGRSIGAVGAIGLSTLLLPQSQFRKIVAIPPMLWIVYNLRQHTAGRIEEDYLTAINVCMTLIRFVDFCVLRTPEQTLRRIRPDGTTETAEEIQSMTLLQKLRWNFDLFTTMRGIGWNWRVKNVDDVPPDISRSRFALEQLARASYCFLYIDLNEWYMRRTPFGDGTTPMPDFFSISLGQQVFLSWFRVLHNGFTMVFGYYLLSAIVVGMGITRPQSWPPLMGSFIKKGRTVRAIWGSCWHQLLRRMFETANSGLTSLFRLKKGTLASRYVQLYNAFLVSALIHHIGALNCPYSELAWCQLYFFMIQPVAITVEDFAIYLGKKAGLRKTWKTKAIGYLWVGCFLSYSLRYATKAFMAAGLGAARHPFVEKFSIMDRLFG